MSNSESFSSDSDSDSSIEVNKGLLCQICYFRKELSELVTLDCKHYYCLICLEEFVLDNFKLKIKCPNNDCVTMLKDSQIREVLSEEDVKRFDALSLENIPNTHRCLMPDCSNLVWYDKQHETYTCDICSLFNCIKCKAAHKSLSCSKYKRLSSPQAEALCAAEIERARTVLQEKTKASGAVSAEADLVLNKRVFMCHFCDLVIGKGSGVQLRSCDHLICRECLKASITTTPVIPPKCQFEDCTGTLQDREVYAILTEDELGVYERKNFTRIKLKLASTMQCQEANCDFFCELTNPDAKVLYCPKCNGENCLKCRAIHRDESCDEYQQRIQLTDIGINEAHIKKAIEDGECMKCPDCLNLVKKGRGCNWIQCSNCGLELCWMLKIRRWGPGGRGDTSGGCRCEVEDYCHPDCGGCIPDN